MLGCFSCCEDCNEPPQNRTKKTKPSFFKKLCKFVIGAGNCVLSNISRKTDEIDEIIENMKPTSITKLYSIAVQPSVFNDFDFTILIDNEKSVIGLVFSKERLKGWKYDETRMRTVIADQKLDNDQLSSKRVAQRIFKYFVQHYEIMSIDIGSIDFVDVIRPWYGTRRIRCLRVPDWTTGRRLALHFQPSELIIGQHSSVQAQNLSEKEINLEDLGCVRKLKILCRTDLDFSQFYNSKLESLVITAYDRDITSTDIVKLITVLRRRKQKMLDIDINGKNERGEFYHRTIFYNKLAPGVIFGYFRSVPGFHFS